MDSTGGVKSYAGIASPSNSEIDRSGGRKINDIKFDQQARSAGNLPPQQAPPLAAAAAPCPVIEGPVTLEAVVSQTKL